MYASAASDIETLVAAMTHELTAVWSVTPASAILLRSSPRFEF